MLGCDMLKILYDSDVKNGYYQGWRDQVTNSGGYLLSLVHMGVIIQSTLESQIFADNPDAWKAVQITYGATLANAAANIKFWD